MTIYTILHAASNTADIKSEVTYDTLGNAQAYLVRKYYRLHNMGENVEPAIAGQRSYHRESDFNTIHYVTWNGIKHSWMIDVS